MIKIFLSQWIALLCAKFNNEFKNSVDHTFILKVLLYEQKCNNIWFAHLKQISSTPFTQKPLKIILVNFNWNINLINSNIKPKLFATAWASMF